MLEKCPCPVGEDEHEPNVMRSGSSQTHAVRLRGRTWGPRMSCKRLRIILYKQIGWQLGVSFLMFLGRTNLSATGSPQYKQSFLICKI